MALKVSKSNEWLRYNLIYLPIGLITGLMVFLIRSAFTDSWHIKSLFYSLVFGTCISLSITNSLLLALKYFLNWEKPFWNTFLVYFFICGIGMIVGIELAYLILHFIYGFNSTFPHWNDYLYNLIIVLGICSVLYAANYGKAKQETALKEKELDLLKLKQLKTQVELDALQAKINPHFLYNALNSIAALIKEDPDQAETMTIKLAKLFRYSINSNHENLITLREELEIVDNYLQIEKIRFGNRITFIFEVEDAVLHYKVPRFLLQPMVENAIKHGLKDCVSGGLLTLKISEHQGGLKIALEDNGIPFPEELHIGYGLQSTYDKLTLLYGDEASIQLVNHPTKEICILIPIKQ